MSINVETRSLFPIGYSIRYLTGWDRLFKSYNGNLIFYPGDPKFIVDVCVLSDINVLREEDITITVGNLHNAKDLERIVTDNTDTIYEICRLNRALNFCLDLKKMKVIEESDFTELLPSFGLNTLFMFSEITSNNYYCVVNATTTIKDRDFYAWFLSYIYSSTLCLKVRGRIENYAKMFLQGISYLAATGNKKEIHIANTQPIFDCGITDCGELLLSVPGSTKRLEELVAKSKEQISKRKKGK